MNPTGGAEPTIRFGIFEVDPRSGELRKAGSRIRLQDQPFKVLLALLERPGDVVTREELRQRIWPTESFGDFDHAVNVAIAKLRTALGDSADIPRYVETLHRRGYRFIYPVAVPDGQPAAVSAQSAGSSLEERPPQQSSIDPVHTRDLAMPNTGLRIGVSIGIVTVLVVAVFWFYRRSLVPVASGLRDLQITRLTNRGNVAYVGISPDGRYIVYALRDKAGLGLWTREVGTHSDVQIVAPGPDFRGITFSPDGQYIFFPRLIAEGQLNRNLYTMPVLGGTPRLLLKGVDAPVSFSPDGHQFMFVRKDIQRNVAEVRVANADGSEERLIASIDHAGGAWPMGGSWSPDGHTLAVTVTFWGGEPGYELDTINLRDGSRETLYKNTGEIGHPMWVPEANEIITSVEDKSGRSQIWAIPYPKGEPRHVTHDLEDYHPLLDMTRDGKTIVANAWTEESNLYVMPVADFSQLRQITFGQQQLDGVTIGSNGRLIVHEAGNPDGELWAMNLDGSQRVLFNNLRETEGASRCGPFVVFTGPGGRLIRADADGLNPIDLVTADALLPSCPADGHIVFYADWISRPQRILRVPVAGGAPTEIGKVRGEYLVGGVVVSPDGKFLAYPYEERKSEFVHLVIIPSEGGPPAKTFDGIGGYVRWSPDGRALHHFKVLDGVVQLVEQPLSGGAPRAITKFLSGRTYSYDWSLDGKQLYILHGEVHSDAVLITNFR